VKQFLANKNITVLEHPPYSSDLTPCNFYPFPKIKSVLKGTHFVSAENVRAKTAEILNSLIEHDLQNCFLNIGSIVCSCVLTQKRTILKVIIVDFLNFLIFK
jgi:histone-lysine N-methyltransferase SETMAR